MSPSSSACPCGSGKELSECCEPYIKGGKAAPTAEALMRSRYTAFTLGEVDYVHDTLAPEERATFDRAHVTAWATQSQWQGLEVRATKEGGSDDTKGSVEFIARFHMDGQDRVHHETGRFRKDNGIWLYVDGNLGGPPHVRQGPKIGRNDRCPCNSGKKYKVCCGR